MAQMDEEKGNAIISNLDSEDLTELGSHDDEVIKILDYLEKRTSIYGHDLKKVGINLSYKGKSKYLLQKVGKLDGYRALQADNKRWYVRKE